MFNLLVFALHAVVVSTFLCMYYTSHFRSEARLCNSFGFSNTCLHCDLVKIFRTVLDESAILQLTHQLNVDAVLKFWGGGRAE